EEGKKKEERTLLLHLRETYRIPRFAKVSDWLAKRIPVEEVFVEIVNHLGPFARMLAEIFGFLDGQRSTILGKAEQFAFRFDRLADRVPFGLVSFPKTFIDVLKTGRTDIFSFNQDATGRLLVDTPDYRGDTGALQNLAHHAFLHTVKSLLLCAPGHIESERFLERHAETIERTVASVRQVLEACNQVLIHNKERNDDLDCIGYGGDELHFYYRTTADRDFWTQTVADYNNKKIDRFVVFDRDRDLGNTFRRFNLTQLHELSLASESYAVRLRDGIQGDYDPGIPEAERWEVYSSAFEDAFRLLIPKQQQPVEMIQKIVDSVILPYWRHRWRLYELWAVVFTMGQRPPGTEAVPRLAARSDDTDAFEWPIPHGDAKHPVGEIIGPRSRLEVWFQRKTPHLGGKGHIEPDIRITKPSAGNEDVFILQLKDRHNGPLSHVHEVIDKYSSGSSAQWVCVAYYSSFRCDDIGGKLTTWKSGDKTILLADQFKPGSVYAPVVEALQRSIREALGSDGRYDLLVDTPGSVQGIAVRDQVQCLVRDMGEPRRIYTFSDKLSRAEGAVADCALPLGGGTDLRGALEEYLTREFDHQVPQVVVITDSDGVGQEASDEHPTMDDGGAENSVDDIWR
ncbi:MAG: hypothetical protein ACKPBV_06850, partial [Sphaerospermopsis kisseleviana]